MEATVGGECVTMYNDIYFERIRNRYGISISMISSREVFSFDRLQKGGGKGGSLMQFTEDNRLLVKALSGDDHESLLRISENYCDYIAESSNSLLVRFFFHFQRTNDGKNYVVMNSCLPPELRVDSIWDLKGCADDKAIRQDSKSVPQVHKRFYMVHWLCAESFLSNCCAGVLPEGRRLYKESKMAARAKVFHLEERDCAQVKEAVRRDTSFLRERGLMDYSLLVGTSSGPAPPSFPKGSMDGQPLVCVRGGQARAHYIGIIDFLQGWTTGKRVAHVIKCLFAPRPISTIQPAEYAEQFLAANDRRFLPPAEPPEAAGGPPGGDGANGTMTPSYALSSPAANSPAAAKPSYAREASRCDSEIEEDGKEAGAAGVVPELPSDGESENGGGGRWQGRSRHYVV